MLNIINDKLSTQTACNTSMIVEKDEIDAEETLEGKINMFYTYYRMIETDSI